MWRELEENSLGLGVVSVDARRKRVAFGVKTVQAWNLGRFRSVTVLYNDEAGLAGFQFYENGDGKRQITAIEGL